MNIYAKEGDKVIFCNPKNGYDCDKNQCAKHLKVNQVYTVDFTDVGQSSTRVYLKEFHNVSFNSVMFDDFIEDQILLKDACIRDIIAKLRRHDDVYSIVNDSSSKTCIASVQGGDMLVETGEHIILMVKGLY